MQQMETVIVRTPRPAECDVRPDRVSLSWHLFKLEPSFHGLIQSSVLIMGAQRGHVPAAHLNSATHTGKSFSMSNTFNNEDRKRDNCNIVENCIDNIDWN